MSELSRPRLSGTSPRKWPFRSPKRARSQSKSHAGHVAAPSAGPYLRRAHAGAPKDLGQSIGQGPRLGGIVGRSPVAGDVALRFACQGSSVRWRTLLSRDSSARAVADITVSRWGSRACARGPRRTRTCIQQTEGSASARQAVSIASLPGRARSLMRNTLCGLATVAWSWHWEPHFDGDEVSCPPLVRPLSPETPGS